MLNEFANREIRDEMLIPQLNIDAEVSLEEITPRFFHILKQFAPFGPGNARPLFVARNIEIAGYPKVVGKDHLKFRVKSGPGYVEAIAFGMGSRLNELAGRFRYDFVFNVEENEYRGTVTQQLRIHDFRLVDAKEESVPVASFAA